MKKTLQSMMTAAMFAAAAAAATGALSAASENMQAEAMEAVIEKQTTTGTTIMTLYGPPPVDYTDEETNDCERIDTTTTETTTTVEILYGPPSVLFKHGDLNFDRQFDARDLTLLKKELLRYQEYLKENPDSDITLEEYIWDSDRLDVNYDGKIDKEDIKELRRKLTGKSKEQEEAEEREGQETTTAITTTATTLTTTITTMTSAPLYGPPWVFTTTVEETQPFETDVTEMIPQPVYGPMPVEETE